MPSPFKPSDLSFIPELFFDLIARILPGSLILGVTYLYLIANDSVFNSVKQFLECHKELLHPPGWFLVFLLIGLSYYFAVGFAIVFRNCFDYREEMEKMERDILEIYDQNKTPVEDQPRFLRIIAEKCAAISLMMGLSVISLLALALTEMSYINSGYFSFTNFSQFIIFALPCSYGGMIVIIYKDCKDCQLNLKTISTFIFIYVYTFITEVYLSNTSIWNGINVAITVLSLTIVFFMYIWNERINEFLKQRLKQCQDNKVGNRKFIEFYLINNRGKSDSQG